MRLASGALFLRADEPCLHGCAVRIFAAARTVVGRYGDDRRRAHGADHDFAGVASRARARTLDDAKRHAGFALVSARALRADRSLLTRFALRPGDTVRPALACRPARSGRSGIALRAGDTLRSGRSGRSRRSDVAFGACFELPVLLTLLAKVGIVSSDALKRKRRYAIVFVFIAAAVVTPPDVLSQVSLAVPLLVLYEASIWLAVLVEKKRAKADLENKDDEDQAGGGEVTPS